MENKSIEQINEQIAELVRERETLSNPIKTIQQEINFLLAEKERQIRAKVPYTDKQLEEVASKLSSKEVSIFFDEDPKDEENEDDGFIHVTRKGVRFCKEGSESQISAFARHVEKELNKLEVSN